MTEILLKVSLSPKRTMYCTKNKNKKRGNFSGVWQLLTLRIHFNKKNLKIKLLRS